MTWAKLDDQFPEHPRISELSDKAFRTHVTGLCIAARRLTDGHLNAPDVRVILALARSRPKHLEELVGTGVWTRNGNGGYVIRDYLDYNPSAKQVKDRRKAEAERLKAYRERSTR
jgi:hypothetical protein